MPPVKPSRSTPPGALPEKKAKQKPVGSPSGSRTVLAADRVSRWIALFAVFVATVLLVTPSLFRRVVHYPPGVPAPENIEARISFSVPNEGEKERLIRQTRDQSPYYYRYEKSTEAHAQKKAADLFSKAASLREDNPTSAPADIAPALVDYARAKLALSLEPDMATLLMANASDQGMLQKVDSSLTHLYTERFIVDDLSRYRLYRNEGPEGRLAWSNRKPEFAYRNLLEPGQIHRYVEEDYLPTQAYYPVLLPDQLRFITYLVSALAQTPNIVYDPDTTESRLSEDLDKIQKNPPLRYYAKGTILVEKGQPVNRDLVERMETAYTKTNVRRLAAIAVYIALLFALVLYYIRQFKPDLGFSTRNVLLVSTSVVVVLLFGRIFMETMRNTDVAGYMFPAGIIGMLTVIVFDARLGILLVTTGALAFAVATGLDFKVFLTALLGGYMAVAALTTIRERRDVLRAGVFVGLVNAVVMLLVNYINDPNSPKMDLVLWGFGNGIVCAVLTIPMLLVFEWIYGVVTDVKLLELTGLNNRLLQLLEEKAPGSYQHSLNVVKLSEAAAKAIGANYLLVRAGAYFHDVGKILKPKYFGENQISLDEKSLHSKISPYMSAMVIKNHVKAGIDLARQYHLPERIVDFIPQHQGTTIISYFYHEALKRFENSESMDPVHEEDFRYPGPKPQTIETAIVMLADSVEATVTSRFTSLSVNEDELHLCVQKTIADKFADGQFDECDLTLRDLHLIRESFVKTLLSRFHQRVAYPSTPGQSGPAGPSPKRDRIEHE